MGGKAINDIRITYSENEQGALADSRYDGLVSHHLLKIAQTKAITAQCNRIELDTHQLRHTLVVLLKSGVK